MTRGHCHDWFRKWKREYNFCGLRPQDAKEMDNYIEISEKIARASGKDEDFVHDHFTAGAARPLLRCKDDEVTTKALNYVVACIKREEDITGGDLDATIKAFLGKGASKPQGSTHLRTETVVVPVENSPFVPQPNSIPQTDTPPQPSLKEQQGLNEQEKNVLEESMERHHDVLTKLAEQLNPSISGIPCLAGKSCQHVKTTTLGRKCDMINLFLNQLSECPFDMKARKASMFTTALDMAKPVPVKPLIITPVKYSDQDAEQMVRDAVRGNWTPTELNDLNAVMKQYEAEGLIAGESYSLLYKALVEKAAERMGA